MRTYIFATLMLINHLLDGQTTCNVWQWTGTDSANKIIASTKSFDSNGNIFYEKVNEFLYWPNPYGGTVGEYFSDYRDTTLMRWTYAGPNGDSSRIEYQYDTNGRLVREVYKRYSHVPTDTMQSGMFTVNIVTVDSSDNHWTFEYERNYTYDSAGRKTQIKTSNPDWSVASYNRWAYDTAGRIVRYERIFRDKMQFSSTFAYASGQVIESRTYYDDQGNIIKNPGRKDPPYMHQRVIITIKDEQGRDVEERTEGKKHKLIERIVYSYNEEGKLSREVWYDGAGKVVLTHVFVYK